MATEEPVAAERKDMKIYDVLPQDHRALAAYAAVHRLSMADAFGMAVAELVAKLDGVERIFFDKIMAGEAVKGCNRRGRKP